MNETTKNSIEQRVQLAFPFEKWSQVKTLVAVSGGPDSVALLSILNNIAKQNSDKRSDHLIVAHVNHGIRGEASNADESFVRNLADELDRPFEFKRLKANASDEESLRNLRYEFLLETAGKLGARYIALGHNLDDQVETILFRIFRGTGISGLSGIPMFRLANESTTIARPLLECSRQEITGYLESQQIAHRIDATNSDPSYTRNFLRNELIPKLETRFGLTLSESIKRLGLQANETTSYLTQEAKQLDAAIVEQSPTRLDLHCPALDSTSPLLIRHWLVGLWSAQGWPLQDMTFSWWERLASELKSPGQSNVVLNLPGSVRFERIDSTATLTLKVANKKKEGQ